MAVEDLLTTLPGELLENDHVQAALKQGITPAEILYAHAKGVMSSYSHKRILGLDHQASLVPAYTPLHAWLLHTQAEAVRTHPKPALRDALHTSGIPLDAVADLTLIGSLSEFELIPSTMTPIDVSAYAAARRLGASTEELQEAITRGIPPSQYLPCLLLTLHNAERHEVILELHAQHDDILAHLLQQRIKPGNLLTTYGYNVVT